MTWHGMPPLPLAILSGVAAHRADIVEYPLIVAPLLIHVDEKRRLVAFVAGPRGGERQKREGMFDVVIGFGQEAEIHLACPASSHRVLDERDRQKPLARFRGLFVEPFEGGHACTSKVAALSCR